MRIAPGGPTWPLGLDALRPAVSELWVRGDTACLAPAPRIAIVGSRSPTGYGLDQARRFGAGLACAGCTVVSGMARGIDAAAHEGALDAGGRTIAVLGSGVDRPWPAGPLAGRLAEEGLLVSEYGPGVGPRRHHFPLRNRILAGLADGVLVVEAAVTSGSRITARWALDLGRDVFCIPGRIDHPLARGVLQLIREGAQPVEGPAQLLEDLYGVAPGTLTDKDALPREVLTSATLRTLIGETLTAEDVAAVAGQPVHIVLSELVRAELKDLVVRGPGGLWRLAQRRDGSDARGGS
jgi:DNA processing protein